MRTQAVQRSLYSPGFLSRFILFLSLSLYLPLAQAMNIDELMLHIDRLWRGDTSKAIMSMTSNSTECFSEISSARPMPMRG